ncbi:hypothetical protein BOO86_12580 [Mycobacterium sp. CBMA 234]|uniref:adenylate/guanylate cyclase domain-containing protein n=1 Tax=Mycolicibacterium sp. CBMA 234 TaxID=1918495 RepID=UPI001391E186|nr:adenylate/guanylate cyclase domain-containing protein [Mycolicibacterium sp. CBMA 234]MUL65305.1 hypothetical protein [Mycolicibacterium sp. CBMA 234]
MVDFDALEAAGIGNARDRAPLIEFLDGLGFTTDEMAEAERRGRLFGLAGDATQSTGQPIYSLATAAQAIGLPLAEVQHAWAVLGLTVADTEEIALAEADVEGLRTWAAMKRSLGDDAAFGFLRVLGSAMARLAEAESSMVRTATPDLNLSRTHDELVTAQAYHRATQLVPRIGGMIDAVHRRHLLAARAYFEGIIRTESDTVECGVGFADLSNFTVLTRLSTADQLSTLLNDFSAVATDVVHAQGGRVVKFIGDAVMWVSATPESLARAALALVRHPHAAEAGVQVRGGLSFGSMLATGGDYFGTPVNLAARLVAAAQPGQVLVAAPWYDIPRDWPIAVQDPLTLKGFDEPVTAYQLCDHL